MSFYFFTWNVGNAIYHNSCAQVNLQKAREASMFFTIQNYLNVCSSWCTETILHAFE